MSDNLIVSYYKKKLTSSLWGSFILLFLLFFLGFILFLFILGFCSVLLRLFALLAAGGWRGSDLAVLLLVLRLLDIFFLIFDDLLVGFIRRLIFGVSLFTLFFLLVIYFFPIKLFLSILGFFLEPSFFILWILA